MVDVFRRFTDELAEFVVGAGVVNPAPLVGFVVSVSSDLRFCSVRFDGGVLVDVPCHGLPVVGDSVIVHFVGGNYEQPVADCARRLPAGDSVLEEFYSRECFNFLSNGDFSSGLDGFSVSGCSLVGGESYTESGVSLCLDSVGSSVSFRVSLPDDVSDFFKFQCVYRGEGRLRVECRCVDSGELLCNVPLNMASSYKVWTSEACSRWSWVYNKVVFDSHDVSGDVLGELEFTLSNVTVVEREYVDSVCYETRPAMLLDALLVYNEDNDRSYYKSLEDVLG